MPLSEKTASELSFQRDNAWRMYSPANDKTTPKIWSSIEDWQWLVRGREQTVLNAERKKQWATKLRFIRPDVKKSLTKQLTEVNQDFNRRIAVTFWKQARQGKSLWDQILKNQKDKNK